MDRKTLGFERLSTRGNDVDHVRHAASTRIVVRVYPNAKRTAVGGRYGDTEPAVLVVRVQAPAVGGKANDAVIAALADAFDVPKNTVRMIRGHSSRTKTVEVDGINEAALQPLLVVD